MSGHWGRSTLFDGRRYSIGAELTPRGVSFRVWAPQRRSVTLLIEDGATAIAVPLTPEPGGYFSAVTDQARTGTRYRFRLDDEATAYPDPASRFQPEGPHGPSQVVDPQAFRWTDEACKGLERAGQVLYELHIGTFTPEGTWAAAARKLPHLVELGITAVEVMPVSDFPGEFGWGYDGVNLFAPTRLYGSPDDFRRFVNRAHELGLGVILDVVYNHLGPDGNFLPAFSPDYFTDRYKTDWGAALNFDGDNAEGMRTFVTTNAAHWIDEYHLDGLRLDATQNIYDSSSQHIIAALIAAARSAAGHRSLFIVAENEPQDIVLVRQYGVDALWNDDLHHSAHVALSGHSEAYYSDYRGRPQEFISALKYGYLYQGQWYAWQKQPRGTAALNLEPAQFIAYIQNHDQIANSGLGMRGHQHASPGRWRAITALMLLGPSSPMLFQGQEFSASAPFLFFADHHPELAKLVDRGRREFLAQFPSLATAAAQEQIAPPADRDTFERCRLDWSELDRHHAAFALHRDLLRLRRADPVLSRQSRQLDGAVLADEAFTIRFVTEDDTDRLLLVNLGGDLVLSPVPEPLLAPPNGCEWRLAFSTEELHYGGGGVVPPKVDDWRLQGGCAMLFVPERRAP